MLEVCVKIIHINSIKKLYCHLITNLHAKFYNNVLGEKEKNKRENKINVDKKERNIVNENI